MLKKSMFRVATAGLALTAAFSSVAQEPTTNKPYFARTVALDSFDQMLELGAKEGYRLHTAQWITNESCTITQTGKRTDKCLFVVFERKK